MFDKQQSQSQIARQVEETWQTSPVSDPDKLLLIRAALHKVLNVEDPALETLNKFFTSRPNNWAHYENMVRPGWLCVGTKADVPKKVCYVGSYEGCCGKIYVWTGLEHERDLADLTLAILDVATLDQHAFADVFPGPNKLTVPKDVLSDESALRFAPQLSNDAPDSLKKAISAINQHIAGNTFGSEIQLRNAIDQTIASVTPQLSAEAVRLIKQYILTRSLPPPSRQTAPILSPRAAPILSVPGPPTSSP